MTGALLHFFSGANMLTAPWRNYGVAVDFTKRLPFEDRHARYILAEGVISQVPFADGFRFLQEARRVLLPGGVLRLSFPDVSRLGPKHVDAYSYALSKSGLQAHTLPDVYRIILAGHGTLACWTRSMIGPALMAAGFKHVFTPKYGKSSHAELTGVDGRHLELGLKMAVLETCIVEAR